MKTRIVSGHPAVSTSVRSIAAAAALCCAGLASAQGNDTSTVTLYGVADGGITHVSGLRAGSVTQIASGIMEGSRWGLKGNEDLGGGFKAIFTLENRFELDTGSLSNRPISGTQLPDRVSASVNASLASLPIPAALKAGLIAGTNTNIATGAFGVNLDGKLFDRQAFTGLITPVGAFTLGRQYTPGYLITGAFDASQTQSSLAAGQVASLPAAFDIRLSNTLQYGIRTGGITATLMYGAGEVAGDSSAGRFLGGMVMYKGNGFSVGYGHNQKNNEAGQKSLTNDILGATVDVGPGTVYGQYATIKDDNPSGLATVGAGVAASAVAATAASPTPISAAQGAAIGAAYQNAYLAAFRQDANLMHIGYKITSGVHTVVVAFNRLNDKRTVNADTDSYGAAYTYALSKRTNLNAVLTRFNNKGNGQLAPGGNGYLGGVTSEAGVDSTSLAFGVRHTF